MTRIKRAMVASLAAHAGLLGLAWLGPGPAVVPGPAPTADAGCEYALYFPETEERTMPVTLAPPAPPPPAPFPDQEAASEPGPGPAADTGPAVAAATAGASGAGNGGLATPSAAPATFFQIPVQGGSVVFVLDRSSSMGLHGRWTAARRELLASLDRLPASARFQIVVFNSRTETFRLDGSVCLMPATAENRARAAAFLANLPAEGGTAHVPAFRAALALDPDQIFFLTDADDLKAEEVRLVTQLNRGRANIHTIELTLAHRGRADMPLQVLARTNRGSYRAVAIAP